ncbi:MAG: HEAT repeat domain-containing protein [Cyanobacteria bacterium P01_F01_bin.13]
MVNSFQIFKNVALPLDFFAGFSRQLALGFSVLAFTAPQIVLASSQYPPLSHSSYDPFDTVCSDEEIEQTVGRLSNTDQTDVVFRALTACGAESVPTLLTLFKLGTADIQSQALNALIDIGPEAKAAIPDLTTTLYEEKGDILLQVPYAIGTIGQEDTVPILVETLNHPNVDVREEAASALGDIGPAAQSAVPALRDTLQNSQMRNAVARALGDIGPGATAAVPDLIVLLADSEADNAAITALGRIGRGAVPELINALISPNAVVRQGAVDALRRMDTAEAAAAVPALIQALQEDALQFYAVDALAKIGPDAAAAVPALIPLLANERLVIDALANIGESSAPALIDVLNSPSAQVRGNALKALARIGPQAATAVPAVIPLLGDRTALPSGPFAENVAEIRIEAIKVLAAIGPDAGAAISDLMPLLQDANEVVRIKAALALASIGSDAVPALSAALNDSGSQVQILAAIALGEIGPEARAAVPQLVSLLNSPPVEELEPEISPHIERPQPRIPPIIDRPRPPWPPVIVLPETRPTAPVQLSAALALGKMGVPNQQAVPYLITLLRNEDADIQAEAADALGNMGATAQAAIPDLVEIMGAGGLVSHMNVVRARNSATEALVKIGAPAVSALIETLKGDNVIAQSRGTYALTQIGASAIPSLIDTLAHSDIHVRRRAAFALGKMETGAVPALVGALQSTNVNMRQGVAAALGMTSVSEDAVVIALETIVANNSNNLDLRRVAASALEQLGGDAGGFFETYDLLGPQTAACPRVGISQYEFDVLTGNCLVAYQEDIFLAGLGELFPPLCKWLRC